MPWREMVKICREEGVYSVVDAAHSIGQELNIKLDEAQPDFWFSVRYIVLTSTGCATNFRVELSQMALRKAKLRSTLCSQEVRLSA